MGGHCSVVHPPPFSVCRALAAGNSATPPPPVRSLSVSALSQSSMNARGDLCAEENPEIERIAVTLTETNGPVVK